MTSRLKVIFFDLGQTLVTGSESSARRLISQGLNLSEKETRRVGRMIMTYPATNPAQLIEALGSLLPDLDTPLVERIIGSIWADQIACVKEIPGTTLLLERLKERGVKIGIISNTWHPFFTGFLQACKAMAELMDYTILSYRYGQKKPSSAIFNEAVNLCGEPPSSICMVGDSYELDITPAMEIGMRTIWVLSRPEREKAELARMLRAEIPLPECAAKDLNEAIAYLLTSG